MKAKQFLLAVLCLLGLTLASCEKGGGSSLNELDGTKWEGRALETDVSVSFVGDECYIILSGYANGSGVGSYKVSSPDVFITITRLNGSSDGQLHVGDVLNGTYNLSTKKMTVRIVLYGDTREIVLSRVK